MTDLQRILLTTAVACLFTFSGCSVLLDFSDCKTDADCPTGSCVAGVCDTGSACTSHGDCPDGQSCINASCVELDSEFCTIAEELESDDETAYVGLVFPYTGRNSTKSEATAGGAKTAFEQINLTHNGINGVKLGAIECDTQQNDARAEEVANYVVDRLGLNVVIGSISSDETLTIADVTIPGNVVLVSPAATSPAITTLDDSRLVWRTIASDALQGPALATMVADSGYQEVLVLSVESAYGQGLFNAFVNSGIVNTDTVQSLNYEVDDNGDLVENSIVDQATALFTEEGYLPDAIVIMGSLESQQLIFALDDTFFGTLEEEAKPDWLLSEAARDPELLNERFADVQPRIRGTFIQTPESSVYDDFRLRFESSYGFRADDFAFADKAYDAGFVVALALGASGEPFDATGRDLANYLGNLASGEEFQPGDDLVTAMNALAEGSIDYAGASGPVDLDPGTGDVVSDITEWRIANGDFESVGVVFSPGD